MAQAPVLFPQDTGGFPRAGEPILQHPNGNVYVGSTPEEVSRFWSFRAFFYRHEHHSDGVAFGVENSSATGTLAYGGYFLRNAGLDVGYIHSTNPTYTNPGTLFTGNALYVYGAANATSGVFMGNSAASAPFVFFTGGTATANERMRIISGGQVAISGGHGTPITAPTAKLHIAAGSTTASTAPLKFDSGSLMSAAEVGAFEFLTDKLHFTITTGTARKEITLNDIALTSTRVPFVTTNGRLTDSANFTYVTGTLTNSNTANSPVSYICNAANNTTSHTKYQMTHAGVETGFLSGTGSSWTPSGMFLASQTNVCGSQAGGLNVGATHASGIIRLVTGGTATTNERMRILADGKVNIGEPQTPVELVHLYQTTNAMCALRVETTSSGTAARAAVRLYTDAGTVTGIMFATASGYTGAPMGSAFVVTAASVAPGGLHLMSEHSSTGHIFFYTGGATSGNERARIYASGSIALCGTAALSTSATDGFVYLPSCAGAPSGTPTSITGGVPMVVDTTNNSIEFYYGGSWKGVTIS